MNSFVLFLASIFTALNPFHTDDRVATVSLIFRVEDDHGAPVEGAKVEVFFDMECDPGETVTAMTGTNGVCHVKGKTVGMMDFRVMKEDYYSTYGKIILNAAGHEHEKEQKIILPQVRNRVAVPFNYTNWRWTKRINEWVGYDLLLSDFVEPYGSGKIADFEIYYEWDGKTFKDFNGFEIRIRFPAKHTGVYWADKFVGSDLKGVYAADPAAGYLSEISFGSRLYRNEKGRVYKRDIRMFDETKTLVGRTRCVVDEHGELVSAIYFQVCNMVFGCDEKGAALCYCGFYNPTPNDTNIEPK